MERTVSRATRARDVALAVVDDGTDDEWRRAARKALKRVAKRKKKFTTDDIWRILSDTRENRAMGPIMLWGARQGICERTDRTVLTTRVSNHARPLTVWRSKIYKGKR